MEQKIHKINNVDFISEELTLEEIEDILALAGQLNIDTSIINLKDAKSLVMGDIISGLMNVIGESGKQGVLSKLLSIVLTKKDSKEKADPEFFKKAKRSEALGALNDFFTGEGSSIFTGIKDLVISIFAKLKPTNPTKD